MKKIILALLVIVIGTFVYADEPVPALRPASPDVPSEVPSNDGEYMPNVIKTHEDVKYEEKDNSSTEQVNGEDEEYEYVEEEETETSKTKPSSTENVQKAEPEQPKVDVPSEGYNPINNDASSDNVQNNNFVPTSNVAPEEQNVKKQKVKKKKAKKEKKKKNKDGKPDFSKYKDAATDPYVQSIYEEKTPEQKLQEEEDAKPKTYSQDDYEQMYRDMKVPEFSFIHGVDPDQYYDMKDTTWSPYPLFRLNSPLYFKTMTIEPGYYLLTPRKYKDDWYILFKESGTVKYIVPAISREFTPANYYRNNLPELDMKKSQRWQIKFLNAWGKYVRKSKRRPAIQTNVELTDLDNNFLLLDLYYGEHKYSCIFRIEKF
ncbi:MAG: hypothetical protein K6E29_03135 [Cyanobacteria bacterium RUI128]|nr:hypothetical protein [Cyanobacteria bacterium RUI128]